MKPQKITWVMPKSTFRKPQHVTDKKLSLGDKIQISAFFMGVAYFVIRSLL